jgi:anthranilate synthase component 1
MNIVPSLSDFLRLAGQGNVIPVYTDLMADFETPVSAYAKLRGTGPSYLLESVEGGENISRYTFIGCRPRKIFICGPETTEIRTPSYSAATPPRIEKIATPRDPLTLIEDEMRPRRPIALPGLPRFIGGAVGFVGYEYITCIEPTVLAAPVDKTANRQPPAANHQPQTATANRNAKTAAAETINAANAETANAIAAEAAAPLLYFMLTDSLLTFDRAKQTLRLCVNAHVRNDDATAAYIAAVTELRHLHALLSRPGALAPAPLIEPPAPVAVPPGNFTRDAFEHVVDSVKEYIRSGDIIQVVPSQRFTAPFKKSPLDLYRALRTVNPSPYMFILDTGDYAIVGASPEVHVRLTDGLVEIRPIAGTRKRGATHADDLALERDLLADEKERAEHLMLVDLARNDIGRVCAYGTVNVPEMMVIERYSHVMHIVSQVEGRIAPGKTAYDLMRATFPAGTVSGAPKIRAMQIIAQNEPSRRGFYAGALGYFGYDGNLDSCIMLRTALIKDGLIHIQAGAGIVADSDPASEYQETINKASALFKAVAIAERL